MINDARLRLFDGIIVHQLDRFARNRYDSAIYKRQLKLAGARVYSVLEHLDDSPESIILESVLEGMAEYFSANLSRTVRVKSFEHAKNGIHMDGIPPLGYDVGPDRKLIINELEATAVVKIFEMHIAGYGYGAIAQHLNDNEYTAKTGRPFGKNSIADILRNEK
jgi:site-specific DNA recombinase